MSCPLTPVVEQVFTTVTEEKQAVAPSINVGSFQNTVQPLEWTTTVHMELNREYIQ